MAAVIRVMMTASPVSVFMISPGVRQAARVALLPVSLCSGLEQMRASR